MRILIMDEGCEPATLYTKRRVSAIKDRPCQACGEIIPKHHIYVRVGILFDEEWDNIFRCLRCEAIHEHLVSLIEPGDGVWPNDRLDCGHTYEEMHGGSPPEEIEALAFALPGDEV